ncbi:MAG: DUF4011 domain-containing protein, partial [candidate division WOR-3 bacterium]|nr:DUF4011 domain-containing protein [candidate division WOR-3 bacterium]
MDEHVSELLVGWMNRLIDMTPRNRLIYYKETRTSTVNITQPSPAEVFHQLVVDDSAWPVWLPPEQDQATLEFADTTERTDAEAEVDHPNQLVCADLERKTLVHKLLYLHKQARSGYEERGTRILHLAFGSLLWVDRDSSGLVKSPLVLVPVELSREGATDRYRVKPVDEEPALNPALRVKLKHDFNVDLPDVPDDWEHVDLSEYLGSVSAKVSEMGWSIEDTSVLSLFSFHRLEMYKDLKENQEFARGHSLVRALAGESLDDDAEVVDPDKLDEAESPDDTYHILDADSSQRVCIQTVRQKVPLVVIQGPPGTGKSQTIANIIADELAGGGRVLFVSEKMAALEAVQKRLEKVGLASQGGFCLELHSHKADRKEVVRELSHSLHHRVRIDRANLQPGDFPRLRRRRATLNGYVKALHEARPPLGRNLWNVLAELAPLSPDPAFSLGDYDASMLTEEVLRDFVDVCTRLDAVWHVALEGDDFPWRGCRETSSHLVASSEWRCVLQELAQSAAEWNNAARSVSETIGLPNPECLNDGARLLRLVAHLKVCPGVQDAWLDAESLADLQHLLETAASLATKVADGESWFQARYESAMLTAPPGTVAEVQHLWSTATRLWAATDKGGSLLMRESGELLHLAESCRDLAKDLQRCVETVVRETGANARQPSVFRVTELLMLAQICVSERRPERVWLDQAGRVQARHLLAELEPMLKDYRSRAARLAERYSEDVYTLDLDGIIERYAGLVYRLPLRWLSRHFRQDRRDLLRVSSVGRVSPSVATDLVEARELLRLRRRIGEHDAEARRLLGSYFDGLNTNTEDVTQAILICEQAIELAGEERDPVAFAAALCQDSPASPSLRLMLSTAKELMARWDRVSARVQSAFPQSAAGEQASVDRVPLASIEVWAAEAAGVLARLTEQVHCVRRYSRGDRPASIAEFVEDLTRLDDLLRAREQFVSMQARLSALLGDRYDGLQTAWNVVLQALAWTDEFKRLLGRSAISDYLRVLVRSANPPDTDAGQLAAVEPRLKRQLLAVHGRFYAGQLPVAESRPVTEIAEWATTLLQRLDDLASWVEYRDARETLLAAGLGSFMVDAEASAARVLRLSNSLRKTLLQSWAGILMAQDPRLAGFRRERHEQLIEEFREVDARLVKAAAARVADLCNSRRPTPAAQTVRDSQIGLLRSQAARQRNFLPIRRLFGRAKELILQLKPCIMMSPLSVSKYLPPDIQFDLVVFDEASQIFTEDAIGAVFRGRRLVAAGDGMQLKPTDFFMKFLRGDDAPVDDEDAEQATVGALQAGEEKSLLARLDSVARHKPRLRWHYRSRHESLIAYSNHAFYYDDLVVFPSPFRDHAELGVKLVHVPDGIYGRGTTQKNPREAERVADLVFEHFRAFGADRSLGVVAFSQPQQEAIEDAIERRRREHPEFETFFSDDRLRGFFVKNLERVQGDERDVIIISVGYGRDEQGGFTLNFGPLSNREHGQNRLNVLITRARERVVVVSSITAVDLGALARPGVTVAPGVQHLMHYLHLAEHGSFARGASSVPPADEESPLEHDVDDAIRQMGYKT